MRRDVWRITLGSVRGTGHFAVASAIAATLLFACVDSREGALQPELHAEGWGIEVSPDRVAAWDTDIAPDGQGLPPGSGSAAQGATLYVAQCQACHGPGGRGGPARSLVSASSDTPTVTSFWPYATTVFDYIRRAMPYPEPGSLSDDDTYAIVAYLLSEGGILPSDASVDASTLPTVRMPNRDAFRWSDEAPGER